MKNELLGEVLRELSARGFRAIGNKRGVRTFAGTVAVRGEAVALELSIEDWDFTQYPAVKVAPGWIEEKALVPHLASDGALCYFQSGSVVLDRYRPAGAIALCLEQAANVLERIKYDPHYRQADIQEEFLAHWLNGQSSATWHVLLASVDLAKSPCDYWTTEIGKSTVVIASSSAEEVATLCATFGAVAPKRSTCPCWMVKSDMLPSVPAHMPVTVHDLFAWLKDWDRKVHNEVQRVLEKEPRYLAHTHATFAVSTPLGWLGFGFALERRMALGAKDKPRLYKQYLHKAGSNAPILRLWFTEVGSSFVHSRNLAFPDLGGKRVTVVGCGAIGSYVAQALVRLGAGSRGGKLTLIDNEDLEPENLGRHTLGYPSLFQPKARALRDELVRQFPFSTVESMASDVRKATRLFGADLVIDATGEEALSELLNAWRLGTGSAKPLLHVWVVGNGEAVQALWAQGTRLGCYRCLLLADDRRYREPRFPLLHDTPVRRVLGCRGFTPYAVSAPMSAAALAADMVADWLRSGTARPTFRTRVNEGADVHRVKNQDLSRLGGCPACGTGNVA